MQYCKKNLNTINRFLIGLFFLILSGCLASPWEKLMKEGSVIVDQNMELKSSDIPKDNRMIDYSLLVIKPEKPGEKFPLIVTLHANGSSGWEYIATWEEEAKKRRMMVVAPTLNLTTGKNDELDLRPLYWLVRRISVRFPVDRNRIFIAGVSAGGLVARWMVIKRPFLWKGVIFIASPDDPWPSHTEVKDFPSILFVHGAYDDQFKLEKIIQNVDILKQKGADVEPLQYPEGKHEHNEEWNKDIFNWIEAHSSIK